MAQKNKGTNKVHLAEVKSETEKRMVIDSEAQRLLVIQREGTFTFRLVDMLHDWNVCIKSLLMPCVVHGQNASDLGMGASKDHCLLCLISPFCVGSLLSVGKSKIHYRTSNSIPGLPQDDNCVGCLLPCCLIAQLRNELNEQHLEEAEMKKVADDILTRGQSVDRE